MQTLRELWQGFMAMPLWVKLWMALMIVVNGIMPLWFFEHVVAQITFLGILIAGPIAYFIVKAVGFNKFLGMMHAPWILMIYLQAHTLLTTAVIGAFGYWLLASLIISSISLLLDILDVIQYTNQVKKTQNKA
ncbi:MAG: hypothetical protein COC24_001230 [Alphaproteobacteria bacterium]|nr:hypothetical protein [Alphaproteobacteria bacterium]